MTLDNLQELYTIELIQLDNFPSYINYSFGAFYELKQNLRIGAGYQFISTGSRLYYEDYSGYIKSDIIAKANSYQFQLSKIIYKSIIDLGIKLNPQFLMNTTKFENTISLNPEYLQTEVVNSNSKNVGIETGIILRKSFNFFEINMEGGYYFDVYRGEIKGTYEGEVVDIDSEVKNNWSGFRLSAGFGILF